MPTAISAVPMFNCLGRKLMQPIERLNPPTSKLVAAYRATVFCVYGNAPIDLTIGAPADLHDAWLTRLSKRSTVVRRSPAIARQHKEGNTLLFNGTFQNEILKP